MDHTQDTPDINAPLLFLDLLLSCILISPSHFGQFWLRITAPTLLQHCLSDRPAPIWYLYQQITEDKILVLCDCSHVNSHNITSPSWRNVTSDALGTTSTVAAKRNRTRFSAALLTDRGSAVQDAPPSAQAVKKTTSSSSWGPSNQSPPTSCLLEIWPLLLWVQQDKPLPLNTAFRDVRAQ